MEDALIQDLRSHLEQTLALIDRKFRLGGRHPNRQILERLGADAMAEMTELRGSTDRKA